MATFVLVHGAWHGAWCWDRLTPELERLGHRVEAVDLPCDDPAALFTGYAGVVERAIEGLGDEPVLVGHSLGGLTIPLVAARRPVRRLVFLCALLAEPGRSFLDQTQDEPDMLVPGYESGLSEPDEQGRRRWVDFDAARWILYADCDEADARWAFERLRPQAQSGYVEPCPLDAFGQADRAYVLCADDQIISPAWSRRAASERLGVEPVELSGSHSPFISRPAELAEVLHQLA